MNLSGPIKRRRRRKRRRNLCIMDMGMGITDTTDITDFMDTSDFTDMHMDMDTATDTKRWGRKAFETFEFRIIFILLSILIFLNFSIKYVKSTKSF
jgi:hypothetical protein